MQVSSEKEMEMQLMIEKGSFETSHHTQTLFFRHKEATEGSETLLTDILASCPRTAASCSFKCSFLLLHFLYAISVPNGECFQKARQLFTSPFKWRHCGSSLPLRTSCKWLSLCEQSSPCVSVCSTSLGGGWGKWDNNTSLHWCPH